MNLDAVKENIQPLSGGRNAALLQNALAHKENLDSQRKLFELEIENGKGSEDPLELWYRYLTWIEQSYPTELKRDSGFMEVLIKCLFTFENEPKYRQDFRLIKMISKLIDETHNPEEHYNRLYEEGIGTKVADFFISWAFHYDISGNMKRARVVYLKGIDAKAEPQEYMNEHFQHFLATSSQRLLIDDEDEKDAILAKVHERRNALSTLSSVKNRVGSYRSGNPSNIKVIINPQSDDPVDFGVVSRKGESLIQMIVDDMVKNENLVSPVAWNSGKRTKKMVVAGNPLNFEILEDNCMKEQELKSRPAKTRLPKNFVSKNDPQEPFECPLIDEENFNVRSVHCFPTTRLYPYPYDQEYSPEEYNAFKWFEKYRPEKCVPRNKFWVDSFENGFNKPLNFVDRNLFEPNGEEYELHGGLEALKHLVLPYPLQEYYQGAEEFSEEEIRAKKGHWTKFDSDTKIFEITVEMDLDSEIEIKIPVRNEKIPSPRDFARLRNNASSKEESLKQKSEREDSSHEENSFQKNGSRQDSLERQRNLSSSSRSVKSKKEESPDILPHSKKTKSFEELRTKSYDSQEDDSFNNHFLKPASKPSPTEEISKFPHKKVFEDLDETSCSTIHFNNFIKMQSISTPIKSIPETFSETDSSSEHAHKKLSTIIEASDSLTGSTLRCNSPKISDPRSHKLEKPLIPEIAPAVFFEEKTETIPNFMLKKANEERTETIPDFLLKKPSENTVLPEISMMAPEKTETINFVLKKTAQSPMENFFEEKTETIPKFKSKKKTTDDTFDFDEFMDIPKTTKTKPVEESFVFEKLSISEKRKECSKLKAKSSSDSIDFDDFMSSPKKATLQELETTSEMLNFNNSNKKSGTMESTRDLLDLGVTQGSLRAPINNSRVPLSNSRAPLSTSDSHFSNSRIPISQRKNSEVLETTKELLNFEVSQTIPATPEPKKPQADEFRGVSIYCEKTPVKGDRHQWNLNDNAHANVEQSIRNVNYKEAMNPFSEDVIEQFLMEIQFYDYVENIPNFESMGNIAKLTKGRVIGINDVKFEVLKLIGEGAFGTVFLGRNIKTTELVAMKQEKPANYWEYYILLELAHRMTNQNLKSSYMSAENVLIGTNSSVIVSKYSPYGDLIKICNKYFKYTSKHLDEYLVMHLTSQLLTVVDTLHAAEIIHADLKADNVMLIDKLNYDKTVPSIQLIDFGVSIDMNLFPKGATFDFCHDLVESKCIEMREKRHWTYQIDLFGVAGIIHLMLFGKYMEVEKTILGWKPINKIPRYFNRDVWEHIFHTLLNVKNCKSMPNLQDLRVLLEEVLVEKESTVKMKISEFNNILVTK
ncbi:BUB1 family protein [Megaselia abdita]